MPSVLTPIVCTFWVNREGLLFPHTTPFIPRDLLDPQGNDTFNIADVDKLDEFLTSLAAPKGIPLVYDSHHYGHLDHFQYLNTVKNKLCCY